MSKNNKNYSAERERQLLELFKALQDNDGSFRIPLRQPPTTKPQTATKLSKDEILEAAAKKADELVERTNEFILDYWEQTKK